MKRMVSSFLRAGQGKAVGVVGAVLLSALSFAAQAEYPDKVVTVVNTWAAGGPSDAIIRPILEKFSAKFGHQFILENRSGANGAIGSAYVARARKDGYTLLFANVGPIAISPSLPDKPPYDSLQDFQPIGQIVSGSTVLVVSPEFPANTLPEFIAYAKKYPGKINYGSIGIGSSTHVAGAALGKMAGLDMVHAPYRGSTQIQVDIMSGQIQSGFVNLGGALELIKARKLKAIAVSTAQRSAILPDVPAVAETVPGFDFNFWYGLMAPAGVPPEITQKLNAALKEALDAPDVKARLLASGLDPQPTTPDAFGKKIAEDLKSWNRAVADAGVKQ